MLNNLFNKQLMIRFGGWFTTLTRAINNWSVFILMFILGYLKGETFSKKSVAIWFFSYFLKISWTVEVLLVRTKDYFQLINIILMSQFYANYFGV